MMDGLFWFPQSPLQRPAAMEKTATKNTRKKVFRALYSQLKVNL
jgi:hypothetical protein